MWGTKATRGHLVTICIKFGIKEPQTFCVSRTCVVVKVTVLWLASGPEMLSGQDIVIYEWKEEKMDCKTVEACKLLTPLLVCVECR